MRQIRAKVNGMWRCCDRAMQELHTLGRFAALEEQQSQKMKRVGMARCNSKNLPIDALGFLPASALVKLHRGTKGLVDVGICGRRVHIGSVRLGGAAPRGLAPSLLTLHSSFPPSLHSSPAPDYHPAVNSDANMVITIDGPAGTGKSTVANAVARRLGFGFLDTGAMYRAVALEALRRNADLENARGIAFIAKHVN